MVVGVVLDERGWPLCCFLLPGNTADITMLVPVVDQLRTRFGIERVCVVADRGLISAETIRQLEERHWQYILGARLRSVKEIREQVLSRAGRYHVVQGPRENSKDPSPLKVKEVWVDERRYIVCHNEEQATKDRHDREAVLKKLADQLQQGPKSLVGNKGFRKYLRAEGEFAIDPEKVASEARFDGKWVLRTNTERTASDVALRYKDLLQVESMFRSLKSLLETRPIFHRCDDTIRGHVFCSFLALLLMKELQSRLESRGWGEVEWRPLLDELEDLQELTVTANGKSYVLRTAPRGDAGKAIQAAGVALGPAIRLA
jgi:transposase